MARLRLGRSYWLDTFKAQAPGFPTLRGHQCADVAIVGGGVTGCAAALLFARAGARVILVDCQRIGRGSSAASTALLMQEPDVDLGDLARRYGPAVARRIWRCSRAAVKSMQQTLDDLDVSSVDSLPSLYYTREAGDVDGLRREAAGRRRAGFPGRWLGPSQVQEIAGLEAEGAIMTSGNAQVDPYRACLALAKGATHAGARLFERSRVRKIDAVRDGVTVKLTTGTIAADWAVVATGYATPEFKPLAGRFRMMNTYVITTPRIPAAVRRRMGLGNVMLWDTGRPYHYLRWTRDRRLLFGGLDRPRVPRAIRPAALRQRAATLMAQLVDLYPALEGLRPEYAWEGLFATTPDGLPYIGKHRHYPRQLFALGYGGNGMTFGFLAAQMLVRIAQGRPDPDDDLFAFGRLRL
jgi:glycine/D-amino acid oxidase-like deaminating enzyme